MGQGHEQNHRQRRAGKSHASRHRPTAHAEMGLVRIPVFLLSFRRLGLQVRAARPDPGFLPVAGGGIPAAWWAFVNEGIRRGADHVAHHIANVGNTLAVHMIFGGLAVLLIPLQVSRMWRRGDRRKHVYLGWALVPIVSIAALTTPPISFNMSYPFWSEAGFALGSIAWFAALVMGIYWIRKGDRERHRRWMVMMAALCFGAVSFRLQLPVLRLFFDMELVFPYLGWTCWVPNVLVVAWWWHRDVARGRCAGTAATPAE
jgi:uncharacterized membrane protein